MNQHFLQIGSCIFAVDHIVAIAQDSSKQTSVHLWTTNDPNPWTFEGEQANALWQWAQSFAGTHVIV